LSAVSADKTNPFKAGCWAKNDLARFLEKYPLIRGRYFAGAAPSEELAARVADEVASWVKLAGYVIADAYTPDGQGNGSISLTLGPDRLIIAYCAGGETTVRELEAASRLRRQKKANNVWVISVVRIAPSAAEKAIKTKIKAMTLGDLIAFLVMKYRDRFAWLLQESRILERYVDIGCEKPTFSSRGAVLAQDRHESIIRYIRSWASEPSSSHLLLLGSFGTGKSWALMRYVALALDEMPANPSGWRLPIYIALNRIQTEQPLLDELSRIIASDYGLTVDARALDALNREGRLILVLDGFDEMGEEQGPDSNNRNLRLLESLLVGRSKVIVASRDHYFKSQWHAQSMFNNLSRDEDEAGIQGFEVMSLSTTLVGFTRPQIREALEKRFGAEGGPLLEGISEVYDMMDYAGRPLLLSMMAEIYESRGFLPKNPFDLYEGYTASWWNREYAKGSSRDRLPLHYRQLLISELAWHMFIHGRVKIRSHEIEEFIGRFQKELDLDGAGTSIQTLESDLRTFSFLIRDADGNYSFFHKSFLEYFVARRILAELRSGRSDCLDLVSQGDEQVFTREVDYFIRAALESRRERFPHLHAIHEGSRAPAARRLLNLVESPRRADQP
jgi:hypothetical protein